MWDFENFLSFRFYVKSIGAYSEALKLQISTSVNFSLENSKNSLSLNSLPLKLQNLDFLFSFGIFEWQKNLVKFEKGYQCTAFIINFGRNDVFLVPSIVHLTRDRKFSSCLLDGILFHP